MLYNVNRDAKKDPKGKGWLDFFPEWQPPKADQTDAELFEVMMMWTMVKPEQES